MSRSILEPKRVRKISSTFAFIHHRFIRDGFFESLNHHELILYLFLVLVGDCFGVSWYAYDKICGILRITLDEYIDAHKAINGFIQFLKYKNLVNFSKKFFQL
jgi:hypothetical protein